MATIEDLCKLANDLIETCDDYRNQRDSRNEGGVKSLHLVMGTWTDGPSMKVSGELHLLQGSQHPLCFEGLSNEGLPTSTTLRYRGPSPQAVLDGLHAMLVVARVDRARLLRRQMESLVGRTI